MNIHNFEMYNLSIPEIQEKLRTSTTHGLTSDEVKERLLKFGYNELEKKKHVSPILIWLSEFKDPLLVILLIAAVISFIIHQGEHSFEAYIIILIVGLNATFSFFQKARADKALDALKKITTLECVVLRDSKEQRISSSEVVPGDIMILNEGDRVPADGRLFEVKNLKTAEAALSGESMPVTKHIMPISEPICPLADRKNMVYNSTLVSFGKGKAIVTATGMQTEIGKISRLLSETEAQKTPLQKNIENFAVKLGKFIIVICVVVFLLNGPIRHPNNYFIWLEQFLAAIALAVAAIPEGLPLVVTSTLAIGVGRIAKKQAIIKKMYAIESLGCTNTICTDKTGTLTKNEMTVQIVWANKKTYHATGTGYAPDGYLTLDGKNIEILSRAEHRVLKNNVMSETYTKNSENLPNTENKEHCDLLQTLQIGLLCNNARLVENAAEQKWTIIGDPTEACLITIARKAGLDETKLSKSIPRIEELPFDSNRKRMATIHQPMSDSYQSTYEPKPNTAEPILASREPTSDLPQTKISETQSHTQKNTAYVKGAMESILALCTHIQDNGKIRPLIESDKNTIIRAYEENAAKAMRGLAFAYRFLEQNAPLTVEFVEKELIFVGMQFMIDPPRDEVGLSIQKCKAATIDVKMITGDNPTTAKAIAENIGIMQPGGKIYEGYQIPKLSEAEITGASVFARVSPEDKQIIVKALQNSNKVVAMTGDGVNDAPALKKADVGVAMGITGTDVSKEAAAMVLLDDNFATLVSAVEEGRGIYGNIKKFVMYLMTTNIVEVIVLLVASILDFPLPLVATQILFINLIIDGPPAISLAFEPYDSDLMQKPPRSPDEQIVNKNVFSILLMRAAVICSWVLTIFFLYTTPNSPLAIVDLPYENASEIPWLAEYAARHLGEVPHEITWGALYLEWKSRSIVFLIVMTSVTANVYNCRSETESIFKIPFFSNRYLNYSVLLCIFLIIAIFWPNSILSPIFSIVPLKWELLWAIPTIFISILPIELMKKIQNRRRAR